MFVKRLLVSLTTKMSPLDLIQNAPFFIFSITEINVIHDEYLQNVLNTANLVYY